MKAVAFYSTYASPKFFGFIISSSVASSSGNLSGLTFPDFGLNANDSIYGYNLTINGILVKSVYPLLLIHLTFYLFSKRAFITFFTISSTWVKKSNLFQWVYKQYTMHYLNAFSMGSVKPSGGSVANVNSAIMLKQYFYDQFQTIINQFIHLNRFQ